MGAIILVRLFQSLYWRSLILFTGSLLSCDTKAASCTSVKASQPATRIRPAEWSIGPVHQCNLSPSGQRVVNGRIAAAGVSAGLPSR